MLYVRQKTIPTIPKKRGWRGFTTKLELAARLVEWIAPLVKQAGKSLWVVVNGGYTKKPFLRRVMQLSKVMVMGRLRKDAAPARLASAIEARTATWTRSSRKYGKNRDQLGQTGRTIGKAGKAIECTVYGKAVTKTYKTFLATYDPVGGVIRVVLVKEDHDWYAFFSTDPKASVPKRSWKRLPIARSSNKIFTT